MPNQIRPPTRKQPGLADGPHTEAMLLWVFTRTNLRILGGYTTIAEWRSVASVFEHSWSAGWGLSLFDQSGFGGRGHLTYYAYETVELMNADGTPRAVRSVRVTSNGFRGDEGGRVQVYDPVLDAHGHQVWYGRLREVVEANHPPGALITHSEANAATGASDAHRFMKNAADLVPEMRRFVLYVDNESSSSTDFNRLVQYYTALFSWLETQPPGGVSIRPGLYGHLNVIGELLKEFPYLYVCDVAYPVSPDPKRPALDQDSLNHGPSGLAVEFVASGHNMIPLGESAPPRNLVGAAGPSSRGPKKPWLTWPAVFQWQGDNPAPLSRRVERVPGSPLDIRFNGLTWYVDYESALVDDPAYPSVSPRMAACTTGQGEFLIAEILRASTGLENGREGTLRTLSVAGPSPPRPVGSP